MIKTITWGKAKRRLTALWFIGAFLPFSLLFLQMIFNTHEEESNKVWEWFLPSIMPTLSLIIGVRVIDVSKPENNDKQVERSYFRLSWMLSFFYLITVLLTLLAEPFSPLSALELMDRSHLWLAPFQGLVSASLGVFFIKTK